MNIVNESGVLFFIEDQISEIPVFWEAEEAHELIRQVDRDGKIHKVHTELNSEKLTYFGLKCSLGKCGFYPKTGQMLINNTCVKLAERINDTEDGTNIQIPEITGNISYRRRVVADMYGNSQTMLSEITFGSHSLMMKFIPNFEIIYSAPARKPHPLVGGEFL